jgi:hypothetical protein
MERWYVYYELAQSRCAIALPRVRQMQNELAAATGVKARLEERIDSKPATTWMEIYEDVADPAAFEIALAGGVRDAQLTELTATARHLERFRVVSQPCA